MITVFRRLRQRLLSGNKFSKYLVYAMGEIILVVIGILIALQINNWNENRKQKAQINSYLEALVDNLQDDINALKYYKKQCLFRFHAQNYLLKHSEGNPVDPAKLGVKYPKWIPNRIWNDEFPEKYNKELASLAITWIPRIGAVNYNESSFSEMNSTGIFSSINNKPLKSKISDYYKEWNSRLGEVRLANDNRWMDQWTNSLIDIGIYPFLMDESDDPLDYVNDPKRLALLERITTSTCYHDLSCRLLIKEATELIEEIKTELSKSK